MDIQNEIPVAASEAPAETPTPAAPEVKEPVKEKEYTVCGITFRTSPKTYFFAPGAFSPKVGDAVIVETARGLEFGKVKRAPHTVPGDKVTLPLREILRMATEADKQHYEDNRVLEKKAMKICKEKILA